MNRKILFALSFVFTLIGFSSCSENQEENEYENWQAKNEHFIDSIAAVARAGQGRWEMIRAYNISDSTKNDKNVGFIREYADTSAITGKPFIPVMISENVSDVYHSKNPSWIREVMRASRISGLEEDNVVRQFTGSYLLKTNFYKPSIGVFNLEIPNPAAASSHIFYNYFLVDSLQVEGRKTYILRFHPKSLVTSPTLDGEMQFDAEDFGIRSVHAQLSPSSNVNWIRHINFEIVNRRLPGGQWFYDEEHLFIDFSVCPAASGSTTKSTCSLISPSASAINPSWYPSLPTAT